MKKELEPIKESIIEKIKNCEEALKSGACNGLGSAGGPLMLSSCKGALEEILAELNEIKYE